MSLFSSKRNYDNENMKPVDVENAKPIEKSFTESFADQWHFQTYTANSYSRVDNLHDEFEKEIDNIKNVTGVELDNPYHTAFGEFFIEDVAKNAWHRFWDNPFKRYKNKWWSDEQYKKREQERVEKFYKKANKLKEQFPELSFRDENTIHDDIVKQAHEYYAALNDGREANGFGDFLGSAAGAVIDPINATLSAVTGGGSTAAKTTVGKALAKTAAYEFVANSGIEAVIQPSVYEYKQELNLPYSKTEALMNVAAVGAGGMILGTAMKGVHLTGKQMLAKFRKAEKAGIKFDGDVKAAADLLEKQVEFDDWSKATNIYGDDLEAKGIHEENLINEMQRLKTELTDMDIGYNRVLENLNGDANEVLAHITPQEMEDVWVNRGGFSRINDVEGSGYGMVKFIFKHGEGAEKAGMHAITKADVVNFPEIVRKYKPLPETEYTGHRIWSVKNADGKQIIYSDAVFSEDGQRHLVTIHELYKKDHKLYGKFSEEKINAAGKRTAHTKDTTQEGYYPTDESSAKASAPKSRFQDGGDVYDNIINQEQVKVKDYQDLKLDDLEADIDGRADWTPEEKAESKANLNSLREQESWDNEILDCIVEFTGK